MPASARVTSLTSIETGMIATATSTQATQIAIQAHVAAAGASVVSGSMSARNGGGYWNVPHCPTTETVTSYGAPPASSRRAAPSYVR